MNLIINNFYLLLLHFKFTLIYTLKKPEKKLINLFF